MKATIEGRDYSILIADDDRHSRDALRDIMEPEGFETLLASSGEEAIELVRGHAVHLVLLDMHMPTLTGLETLLLVRQIKAMLPANVPLLTAIPNLPDSASRRHALRFAVLAVLATLVGCALEAGLFIKLQPIL